MANLNEHRKAIVRALICGCRKLERTEAATVPTWFDLAFYDDSKETRVGADGSITLGSTHEGHVQGDTCIATGLFFVDKLSEQLITISDYGPLWMELWLDCEIKLDEEGDSNTLFPRWLAEVLNEECGLEIKEEDIYDE